jgi:transglutaminase-like putative cysteine protease
MTNHRLTFAAAIAVLAASLSLGSLLVGTSWLVASVGVAAAVALAGTLTRLATPQAAIAACVAVLLAVVPVLAGYGWPGRAGALAVLGLTAASATGARLLRAFAAIATYLAVPFLYLTAVFAGSSAWAGVIPTSRSLAALARLPGRASSEFKYSPPIPTTRPVEFLAVGGVALIAICVDVLAVRLRRPALAGLPLLLLFSVPVASSLKRFTIVQTLLFGLAIAAYLALLASDGRQRLRMWGRLVTIRRTQASDETGQGPDTRQVAASGRRVGLTAVVLAMVVPVFLAGTPPKDLFAKTAGGGTGTGVAIPGGLAPLENVGQELAQKPTLEFSYETTNPEPQQQYFQQYVLNYDYAAGGKWLLGASAGQSVQNERMPYPVPGLTAGVSSATVRTSVSLARIENVALPVPYAPVQIQSGDTNLTETSGTLMVFDPQQLTSGQYTVISKEAEPTAAGLAAAAAYPQSVLRAYTGYRGPDARQLLRIARQHTAGDTTPLTKAADLQRWFNSPAFTYTTHERWPNSGPWLLRFLTKDPRGDCEQFAPAFAVLARLLGIPSRVAIGFTGGTFAGHSLWRVMSSDAHAWPELYFPGAGWVRFEPTPAGSEGSAGQGTATTPDYTIGVLPTGPGGQSTQPTGGPTPSSSAGSSSGHPISPKQIQAGVGPQGSALHAKSGFPVWILVLLAVLLVLASPALARWLTRRRRWMSASTDSARAQTAWLELLDDLADYGLRPEPSESPRAVARRVAAEAKLGAAGSAAVARIGAAEERARYSLGSLPGTELRADVAAARRALAAHASRAQRLRAWLLPPSTIARALAGLQSSGHALSWIEAPLPSWRRSRARPEPHQAR